MTEPVEEIVVVEGFPATWLWQAKIQNLVAVLGGSCSDQQGELIVERLNTAARRYNGM